MKLIKVTSKNTRKPVYINVDAIGHIYSARTHHYGEEVHAYTTIGVTTHNNGGFEVLESPEEIMSLINE